MILLALVWYLSTAVLCLFVFAAWDKEFKLTEDYNLVLLWPVVLVVGIALGIETTGRKVGSLCRRTKK